MTYRIMLLVELTKLSDMSDNFVFVALYGFLLISMRSAVDYRKSCLSVHLRSER